MKILLVNDYGTPTGGAELLTYLLRNGLRQRGHDARVFSSSATSTPNIQSEADYHCFGTHNPRLQTVTQTINLSAYFTLRRVLEDFRPDVVHLTMFLWQLSPMILPLLRGYPCVYHVVTYKPVCPTGSKLLPNGSACEEAAGKACLKNGCVTPLAYPWLMKQQQLFRRYREGAINVIVANSEAVKRQLVAGGLPCDTVIWGGSPSRPIRAPLSSDSVPLAVFAGRLVKEKGTDVLLQGFAQARRAVPTARLIIVGNGPERQALENRARELSLGDRIVFTGQRSRSEMEQHFETAWVQVVPSLWAEPFGLVCTDAMMRGTAVIGSAIGGIAESVLHGKTGFLVTPGSVSALAEALTILLSDRDRAEAMGRAGYERAQIHFSENIFVDRMLGVYETLRNPAL